MATESEIHFSVIRYSIRFACRESTLTPPFLKQFL